MNKPTIKRYFHEGVFNYIKQDFQFLFEKIISSGYEYDFQIRDNYFNLYYKGNSLGKVSYNKATQLYDISIHHKFINDMIKNRFNPKRSKDYLIFNLSKRQLHPFFSSYNLLSMGQKVKEVNYQEETTFEQMLMTDNVNRKDLIIIDRQVVDRFNKTKMDILTLKQKSGDDYQFCVVEVKLGNNPELKGDVSRQIKGYTERISNHFEDYKKCYEINIMQKQAFGLVNQNLNINIVPGVLGVVVVLGYSGIARKNIKELKQNDPSIKVLHLKNIIDISKAILDAMNLTIHRGAKEIGGTCIELRTAESRILLDFGLPLVDENKEPFNAKGIHCKSKKELVRQSILPDIKGLYKDDSPSVDAILLSHPHQDHYGLLSFIHPGIPIFMSQGCKILIEASYFFGQTDCKLTNIQTVQSWRPFKKRDFVITPYVVDHSGFDALAFLIEGGGKKIFYSGDFRGHGRKRVLFESMLKNPPKNIDYLILEGSILGRDKGKYEDEQDIERELTAHLKVSDNLFFISCSTQNIDRLVSIYRSCIKSGRTFVIDPYTAYILDKLKAVSSNIPQYDWDKNIKVFFVPNSYTKKMAENKSLFKFKSAKITYDEIQEKRHKLVIKDSYAIRNIFANKNNLHNSILVYSIWKGYLPEVKPFWDEHNVPIIIVHSSGHAYIEELKDFVKAMKPKWVIPNHTFSPEKYPDHFGSSVILLKDKETVNL